jgi:hypothetical protein
VKQLPPKRRTRKNSRYNDLIDDLTLRLEQTPRPRWLVVEKPMTRQQAKAAQMSITGIFRRWNGSGFIETAIRSNGSPDVYEVYVRRGKNYK